MLRLGLLGIVEVSEPESGYIIPFGMEKARGEDGFQIAEDPWRMKI